MLPLRGALMLDLETITCPKCASSLRLLTIEWQVIETVSTAPDAMLVSHGRHIVKYHLSCLNWHFWTVAAT